MDWITGIGVYFIVWWLTLFMVLPWGNRPIDIQDAAKGQAPSAPRNPRILIKMAVNTVLAGLVWGIVYGMMTWELISFRT